MLLTPLGSSAEASRITMSGDFQNDTVSVARSLKETIAISQEEEGRSDAEKEAVDLITAYISRYRNRSAVNSTVSFTTMQTAGNAMAGHYKNFSNRPLPDQLKERLNNELTKAEKLASNDN